MKTFPCSQTRKTNRLLLLLSGLLLGLLFCTAAPPQTQPALNPDRSPRLALWLAKKDEVLANPQADYDLVMSGWFSAQEAREIRENAPQVTLLSGLTHTWIMEDMGWQTLLVTVANDGSPDGPLQITDGMRLKLDTDGDSLPDRSCSPPGWENISAMDPRDPAWQELVFAFYRNTASQPQHDGVIVDMVDAYPFCSGASSGDVPEALDDAAWIDAQAELLAGIRTRVPESKWVFANAGNDFPTDSPFPQYLNGYLLENFLGSWGAGLEQGLASAQRALETTAPPHLVVFAVDTDDSGVIDWPRVHTGLAASLLLDNTLFAFDSGPADHGGVTDWWLPQYSVQLGEPLGPFELVNGCYRRDYENGLVLVANGADCSTDLEYEARNIFNDAKGSAFEIPAGEAAILERVSP